MAFLFQRLWLFDSHSLLAPPSGQNWYCCCTNSTKNSKFSKLSPTCSSVQSYSHLNFMFYVNGFIFHKNCLMVNELWLMWIYCVCTSAEINNQSELFDCLYVVVNWITLSLWLLDKHINMNERMLLLVSAQYRHGFWIFKLQKEHVVILWMKQECSELFPPLDDALHLHLNDWQPVKPVFFFLLQSTTFS